MESVDLYAEDESKTLCQNWQKLCEAVVAKACVDYEMLHHPQSGRTYLVKWYGQNRSVNAMTGWIEAQKLDLEHAFDNGLGELAEAIDKLYLIRLVQDNQVDDIRIQKMVKTKNLRISKR